VPRGSTRVGQVSKQLPRVTTLLVHVSTGGSHIGVDIWQVGPTHATWHSPTGPHQQPLHQTETHGSTWLSRVNKGRRRGIHLLVHINSYLTRCMPHGNTLGHYIIRYMLRGSILWSHLTIWDTTTRQVAACHEATSTAECHMALLYWSTSSLWALPYHKMTDKWAPLGATLNGLIWLVQVSTGGTHGTTSRSTSFNH
jgi:hypothetical protein